jgi:hypothetical protein
MRPILLSRLTNRILILMVLSAALAIFSPGSAEADNCQLHNICWNAHCQGVCEDCRTQYPPPSIAFDNCCIEAQSACCPFYETCIQNFCEYDPECMSQYPCPWWASC